LRTQEHEGNRKTIAQGRPDRSGEPVVTNSYVFYFYIRGCGRINRPAFPAPSFPEGVMSGKLGQAMPRERRNVSEWFSSFRGARERELWCAIAHLRIHFSRHCCGAMDSGLASSMRPGMTITDWLEIE
jgi:hypothetical protein